MGQELIKSAVDASVFVINLTPALIRFVMAAALVLLSAGRRTTRRREEEAARMADSGQRRASAVIPPSRLWLRTQPPLPSFWGRAPEPGLRGVALHTNPRSPISTCLGGHFNSLRHSRDLPWKAWVKVTADTAVIHKDYCKMSARR